jgi:hypothetical protein
MSLTNVIRASVVMINSNKSEITDIYTLHNFLFEPSLRVDVSELNVRIVSFLTVMTTQNLESVKRDNNNNNKNQ